MSIEPSHQNKSSWVRITITTLVLSFTYAIVRYNVFRKVPLSELPLIISNKALALASVILIAISYALGSLSRFWPSVFSSSLPARKQLGLVGFLLASVHACISLILLTPEYFPRFYTHNEFNINGSLSMLNGVLAFFVFLCVAISSIPSVGESLSKEQWFKIQKMGYTALILVMLHVFFMGYAGWMKVETWPQGLLPISLIAFLCIFITLLLKICNMLVKQR